MDNLHAYLEIGRDTGDNSNIYNALHLNICEDDDIRIIDSLIADDWEEFLTNSVRLIVQEIAEEYNFTYEIDYEICDKTELYLIVESDIHIEEEENDYTNYVWGLWCDKDSTELVNKINKIMKGEN